MRILVFLLTLIFSCRSFAQDTITLHSGSVIAGKVQQVTPLLVKYILNGGDTPVYSFYRNTVFSIRYADGQTDTIPQVVTARVLKLEPQFLEEGGAVLIKFDHCSRGKHDVRYYHNGGARNFAAGFVFGFWGLAAAAAIPPRNPPPDIAMPDYIYHNPAYRECYRKKAKNKNCLYAAAGMVSRIVIFGILLSL